MSLKRNKLLIFFLVLTVWATEASAATIYFKDGTVLEAEIIQRNSYSVVTKTGNKMKRQYLDQIDRIEEDAPDALGAEPVTNIAEIAEEGGLQQSKVQLILNFIEASGVRNAMEKNVEAAIAGVPESEKAKYRDLLNVDEIIERLVPVYDKYYTSQDLVALIRFYDSPVGQKALQTTPKIMEETIGVSIDYIKEKSAH